MVVVDDNYKFNESNLKFNNEVYICGKYSLGGLNFNLFNYCPFCGTIKTGISSGNDENKSIKDWEEFHILDDNFFEEYKNE